MTDAGSQAEAPTGARTGAAAGARDPISLRPVIHGTASGESYWGPGNRCTFLLTGAESAGTMFAFDCLVAPGGGPLRHRHLAEDETFFLYEGTIEFETDGEVRLVSAGELIFIPRGVVHSYRNTGTTDVLMVTIYSPAGMEGWYRETFIPVSDPDEPPPAITAEMIERMLVTGERYNVEWVRDR